MICKTLTLLRSLTRRQVTLPRRRLTLPRRLLSLAGLCAALACGPDQPCDPGQLLVKNSCVVVAATCADRTAAFGVACSAPAQCGCGLDTCLSQGGASYCTQSGCAQDASLCPPGWSCLNLTATSGAASACQRP